jgi:hypothetical protein
MSLVDCTNLGTRGVDAVLIRDGKATAPGLPKVLGGKRPAP